MAKTIEYNQRLRFSYTRTEKNSGDTDLDIDINFENPKDEDKIAERLQTWLNAAGFKSIEVKVK